MTRAPGNPRIKVWRAGSNAARDGAKPADNPYKGDLASLECLAWVKGYWWKRGRMASAQEDASNKARQTAMRNRKPGVK